MKILVHQKNSQPRIIQVADTEPTLGQVTISVEAAAVNPVDLVVAGGGADEAFGLGETAGLGWEAAGTVIAIGADVTGLAVGDRVAALHDDPAGTARAHADRLVIAATAVAKIPDGLKTDEAASVPLNALTAQQALHLVGAPDGRRLLVTGAAGGVGGYVIALAVADGWRVDGLARESDRAFVESTGAHLVTSAEAGAYDVLLDPAVLGDGTPLRVGGDYVTFVADLSYRGRDIRTFGVKVRSDGAALSGLLVRSASGELEPRIAGSYPLTEHAEAYAEAGRSGLRGRVLLVP